MFTQKLSPSNHLDSCTRFSTFSKFVRPMSRRFLDSYPHRCSNCGIEFGDDMRYHIDPSMPFWCIVVCSARCYLFRCQAKLEPDEFIETRRRINESSGVAIDMRVPWTKESTHERFHSPEFLKAVRDSLMRFQANASPRVGFKLPKSQKT